MLTSRVDCDNLAIDLSEARSALESVTKRTSDLFASLSDGNHTVVGSDWTVGQVGAHLSIVPFGFAFAAQGDFTAVAPYLRTGTFAERLSGVTAGIMEIDPERDPKVIATSIPERVAAFLSATAGLPPGAAIGTPWYGEGMSLPVTNATAMLVAEQLIHGWDIAKTFGLPWPITAPEANLVMRALTKMLPLVADGAAIAGLRASYGITVRGGPRFTVSVADGSVKVEPGIRGAPDCRISAGAVPFLLVAYGRVGQWGPIARGQLRAWGRKPWLAFRFKSLFYNP